jgi:predicted enzyme related to lactoylglutathione lyase
MEPRFAVIALWAEDIAATAHFYRDVLQLKLLSHHSGRLHFDINGVYLALIKGRTLPAQNSEPLRFPLFAISVDDLDARVDRLEKHGILMPWGIETNETSRWIMFQDPAGNLIELVQFNK